MPNLKNLDGQSITVVEKENESVGGIQQDSHRSEKAIKLSPVSKPTINISIPRSVDKKPYSVQFAEQESVKIPLKLNEKDDMILQLHNDLQNTKIRFSEVDNDKNQLLMQLESMQSHYEKVIQNLKSDSNNSKEHFKDLNDEIKDLKNEIKTYSKRYQSLEVEKDRYKQLRDEKDNVINELQKDLIKAKTQFEDENDSANSFKLELKQYKDRHGQLLESK